MLLEKKTAIIYGGQVLSAVRWPMRSPAKARMSFSRVARKNRWRTSSQS